jgi:hypothetical protein
MITIDGINYNVPVTEIELSADFLDSIAERTENGDLKRDLIGVYFNQSFKFAMGTEKGELGRLYEKLTEPVEFHEVKIYTPMGEMTFTMYASGIKCKMKKLKQNDTWWSELSVKFTAKTPTRK